MNDMTNHEIALYVLLALAFTLLAISHVRNAHTVNDLTWDRERDKAEYRAAVSRREKQIERLERRMAGLERGGAKPVTTDNDDVLTVVSPFTGPRQEPMNDSDGLRAYQQDRQIGVGTTTADWQAYALKQVTDNASYGLRPKRSTCCGGANTMTSGGTYGLCSDCPIR